MLPTVYLTANVNTALRFVFTNITFIVMYIYTFRKSKMALHMGNLDTNMSMQIIMFPLQ